MTKQSKEKHPDSEPSTFEEAMALLENSVGQLESGELTLAESLEIFEQGIAASRACTRLLDQTRKKVQLLTEKDGELELDFFDVEEGDDVDE